MEKLHWTDLENKILYSAVPWPRWNQSGLAADIKKVKSNELFEISQPLRAVKIRTDFEETEGTENSIVNTSLEFDVWER